MALKLRRLWQPRHPMFWLMLLFNGLSSACTLALQLLPLNPLGLLALGLVALMNLACGLLVAGMLMREPPQSR